MKNSLSTGKLTILLCLVFPTWSVFASPLAGKWTNENPDTRSVPEVEISASDDGEGHLIWVGKTHPENSTYGPFPLHFYGTSAGDKKKPFSATAIHETGFSVITFFFQMDGKELVVDKFTRFTDDSGRTNYRETMVFSKK